MGSDKAEIEVGGEPLLKRLVRLCRALAAEVLVVGRTRPSWCLDPEVEFVFDDEPGLGPVGGLATALGRTDGPIGLLACDLPCLDLDSLRWLQDQAMKLPSPYDGLVVLRDGFLEPTFAVYRPAASHAISTVRGAGRRSMHAVLEQGHFRRLEAPPHIAERLINVNTPADLERALGFIGEDR